MTSKAKQRYLETEKVMRAGRLVDKNVWNKNKLLARLFSLRAAQQRLKGSLNPILRMRLARQVEEVKKNIAQDSG